MVFLKRKIDFKYFILPRFGCFKSFIFDLKSGEIIFIFNLLYFLIESLLGLNKLNNCISKPCWLSDSTHLKVWIEFASDNNNNFNVVLINYFGE